MSRLETADYKRKDGLVRVGIQGIPGFPSGSAIKNPPAMQETQEILELVPGLGRCPRGGHGNPLQYSCLQNPMD